MKFFGSKKRRIVSFILLVLLVSFLLNPFLIFRLPFTLAQTETNAVFYVNGSTYYFNNGTVYSSSDCGALLSNGILSVSELSSSANRGNIAIQTGTYTLTDSIIPQSYVTVTCQPNVLIQQPQPAQLSQSISLVLTTNPTSYFTWNGGTLNGNKGSLVDSRLSGTWSTNFFDYLGMAIYDNGPNIDDVFENVVLENVIGHGFDIFDPEQCCYINLTTSNDGDNPITMDAAGAWNSENSLITACYNVGGQDVGINFAGMENGIITDCTSINSTQNTGSSHWGIAVEYGTNCSIVNCIVSGAEYDIVSTSNNTLIKNCTAIGLASTTEVGIQVQKANNDVVEYNNITDCTLYESIGTYSASETTNLTLIDNVLTNSVAITGVGTEVDGVYSLWSFASGWENSSGTDVTDGLAWTANLGSGATEVGSVVASPVYQGNYALKITGNPTAKDNGLCYSASVPHLSYVNLTFAFRADTTIQQWEDQVIAAMYDASSNMFIKVGFGCLGGSPFLYFEYYNYSSASYTEIDNSSWVPATNNWYLFNIIANISATNGLYQISVNGTNYINQAMATDSVGSVSSFGVGLYGYTGYYPQNMYFDSVSATTQQSTTSYYLTVQSNPYGSASLTAGVYPYYGGAVLISATPNSGYVFSYWLFNNTVWYPDTSSTINVAMTQNQTVQPVFQVASIYYLLAMETPQDGYGGAEVTVSPPVGATQYLVGNNATLLVTANNGYTLISAEWNVDSSNVSSSNPYNLAMNSAHTVLVYLVLTNPSPTPTPTPAPGGGGGGNQPAPTTSIQPTLTPSTSETISPSGTPFNLRNWIDSNLLLVFIIVVSSIFSLMIVGIAVSKIKRI
jgi:hypothetical protein